MKSLTLAKESGFSLIEVLMVFVIIGALASIAIPQYASYQEDANSVSCRANRRNIEMDEENYYLENNAVGLNIDSRYSCPSDGIYVWLKSNPENPEYPQIGCSIHFAGKSPAEDEKSEPESTPIQMIESMVDTVHNMYIPKRSLKNNLSRKLNDAKSSLEKENNNKAIDQLDSFIDKVKKEKGKNIETDDADLLLSKAEEIISVI